MRPEKCNVCLESHFILVWSGYCALNHPGVGREGNRANRAGRRILSICECDGKENTRETVVKTACLLGRDGIVILQENWLVGSMWWYVIGWGKNLRMLHLHAWEQQGRNLIRSHRKERKSSPRCFGGQINSRQSSESWRCMSFYQLLQGPWHLPHLGKLSAGVCGCPGKWQEQPTSFHSQEEKIQGFRHALSPS